MTGFELDTENGSLWLDLHGYTTDSALMVFDTKLKEAYLAGLKVMEVVHGAPYATTFEESLILGRGSIKWGIRNMLDHEEYADIIGSMEPEGGSIKIYLKPNPKPEEVHWQPLPETRSEGRRRSWSAGPQLLPYKTQQAIKDAKAIVDAIVSGTKHRALQIIGCKYIITLSKVIPDAAIASKVTMSARRRRLKSEIQSLMNEYPAFSETTHGSHLAYERSNH